MLSDRARLVLACVWLELASGIPYGVVNELVPVWLRVNGTGLAELGALTLVGLPWSLKPLWAPFVDRHGHFGQWFRAALFVAAVGTVVMPAAPPGLGMVLLLVGLAFASATQDIAIDGYLAARTPPGDQGRINGVRVAAYRAGMAVVGGGAVWAGARWGWGLAFGAVAAVQAGLLLGMGAVPRTPQAEAAPVGRWLATLAAWAREPGTLGLFAVLLLYKLGDATMGPMVKPFLLTRLDAGEVGLLSTTAGAFLVAGGAVIGGELVSRWGLRPALLGLGALQALSNLGYAGAAVVPGAAAAVAASVMESLTGGLGTAGLMALVMRASRGDQVATRFAVCTAVLGLTRTVSGALSGWGVEALGYASYFTATFVLALPALAAIPAVVKREHG